MKSETELKGALLLAAPQRVPDLRLFIRPVAVVRVEERLMRFSIPGQADLYGITRGGKHIELELKALGGVLSDAQKRWRAFCEAWMIPYLLLEPMQHEDEIGTVARWCSEIAIELSLPYVRGVC